MTCVSRCSCVAVSVTRDTEGAVVTSAVEGHDPCQVFDVAAIQVTKDKPVATQTTVYFVCQRSLVNTLVSSLSTCYISTLCCKV